jgi:serine/threonine protein kinase
MYRNIIILIRILKTLGAGQFGFVSKGLWTPPDGRHEVAIKILKPEASENDRLKLLQEAAIMGQFTNDYVVKLHGVVTIGDPVMMVLELMPRGDLRSYLRSIQQKINKMPSLAGLPKLLLKFCKDIASGMKYLSSKSFVHRDLAARNILLSSDLTCKIGDFGMTRDLMQDENDYYKSSGGIIPLKWTAPEALNFKKYTSSSDVWSYGMVLFEIWSLGHKPFNDLSNPIVIALVNSKHCQPPPPGCSRAIYQLMIECWNPEYTLRPSFERIIDYLSQSHEVLFNWNRGDFLHGKKAHLLGAPLDEAGDLYVELQRTYQQSMLDEFQKR